jgi:hypothetical protein
MSPLLLSTSANTSGPTSSAAADCSRSFLLRARSNYISNKSSCLLRLSCLAVFVLVFLAPVEVSAQIPPIGKL